MFFPPDVPAERVDWAVAQPSMAANVSIVPLKPGRYDTLYWEIGVYSKVLLMSFQSNSRAAWCWAVARRNG